MNYSEVIAQQQALANQAMQGVQHWQWAMVVIWLAGAIFSGWVIYMFYGRLRDIANEVRRLRVAYETAHERKERSAATPRRTEGPADEGRYMPRAT